MGEGAKKPEAQCHADQAAVDATGTGGHGRLVSLIMRWSLFISRVPDFAYFTPFFCFGLFGSLHVTSRHFTSARSPLP